MALGKLPTLTGFGRIVAALAMALCLGSCSPPISADDVAKKPEAHLFYPGSQVTKTSPRGEQITEGGTSMAMVVTYVSVDASADDIYSWYVRELRNRGWTIRKAVRVDASYDLFTRGDRELFEVSAGTTPRSYQTTLAIVPYPCATNPPTSMAFVNCA